MISTSKYYSFLLLGVLLLMSIAAVAQEQTLKAFVRASDDFEILNAVMVKDRQSGSVTTTDATGYFELKTAPDHQLEFSRVGINTVLITVKAPMFRAIQQILLQYDVASLDGVSVSGRSDYQKDSLARYQLYQQDLDRKRVRMGVDSISPGKQGFGVTINSPISFWMQYIAPKSKNRIRFQKNFAEWEQQKYIQTIYSKERVAQLTGLSRDSLAWFINAYPMPYETARTAGKKEIDSWILANFEDWKKNPAKIIRLFRIRE
ncbi:MAG: hypothetical protein EOP54_02515 [Sphingobacteriales bacterium]|nr:MAG: hypothetical protein EOP54_02515 [Sphingobacteriales bacterium]